MHNMKVPTIVRLLVGISLESEDNMSLQPNLKYIL